MKYVWLFILLLFVSCATMNLGPAGPDSTPMENANVILIETSDPVNKSFDKLDEIFKAEGFSIKSYNKSQLVLETNFKKYNEQKVWLVSNVIETDSSSVIELSGIVEVPQFQYRKEYGGAKPDVKSRIKKKKSSYNPAWKVMMGIALKYPNGKIWYAREAS
ncbi:hypothetical protein [Fodinibius sp.]|uniref:hypothetical protein n=1 Tax=Fodinibius sp. TaxID=1872440 RepID=UPI002ACD575D|nr:hypothetical protein [Fodinibius sp.]MDZ7659309.1 hypothetical protein [Fodinibius sp.]